MSNTVKQLGFIPTNRGEFDTTGQTRYYKDNVVQYRNGSYICTPVGYSSSNPTAYTTDAPYQDGDTQLNANWKLMASVGLVDEEPTAGSDNLVKSGGVQKELALGAVYDVSAKNPTAGPTNDGKWESLSVLLSDTNLNTLIPISVRKGGMNIKFIQSFDNKYVQFRYMLQYENTNAGNADLVNVANWQGVDTDIVAGSNNIAECSGVRYELDKMESSHFYSKNLVDNTKLHEGKYWGGTSLSIGKYYSAEEEYDATDVILLKPNTNYKTNQSARYISLYDKNGVCSRNIEHTTSFTTNSNEVYVIISFIQRIDKHYQLEEGTTSTEYTPYNRVLITEVQDNAVSTQKLQNGSVTNSKLGTDSVSTNKVQNNAVTESKLSLNANQKLNKFDGYNVEETKTFTNSSSNTYNFNNTVLIKDGQKFYITVKSDDAQWSRFAIFDDVWSTSLNKHDYLVKGTRYEFTANGDITYLEGWLLEATSYGDITIQIETSPASLKKDSVTTNSILDQAVTPIKTSFFESVNLYDVDNDADFHIDGSYALTGYIKVEPDTDYCVSNYNSLRIVTSYNAIGGTGTNIVNNPNATTKTFKTLSNTNYIKIWYLKRSDSLYYLGYGSRTAVYQPYKLVIPSTVGQDIPVTYFPKKVYVAVGRTIELYYDQMILNVDKYHIDATCSIGIPLDRKYQIIGTSTNAGNEYTLTIKLRNDYNEVVGGGLINVYVVSNAIAGEQNILPIGDSLTNEKPWIGELATLSNSKLICVGTRLASSTQKSEGRSGARVSFYTNVSGTANYNYDNYYRGNDYNTVATFDDTASYSTGDKVKIAHTFANGTSGFKYWIYKQNHTPGAFVESEAYCYSNGNPFYDYINQKFSMNFYKTFFGINYNVIMIFLGTNGLSLTPETNVDGALGIKNLIELIREEDTVTPIVIVNTIFRSSQNGIGRQGNSDGYTPTTEYKYAEDLKVLKLAESVDELCGSKSNVYLCPVGFTHDSKYNFGNTKIAVNPRLTDTDTVYELQPLDSVHPQTCGYMQFADEMFSTLCYVFNQ